MKCKNIYKSHFYNIVISNIKDWIRKNFSNGNICLAQDIEKLDKICKLVNVSNKVNQIECKKEVIKFLDYVKRKFNRRLKNN